MIYLINRISDKAFADFKKPKRIESFDCSFFFNWK